jgi:monoamine oxidase
MSYKEYNLDYSTLSLRQQDHSVYLIEANETFSFRIGTTKQFEHDCDFD